MLATTALCGRLVGDRGARVPQVTSLDDPILTTTAWTDLIETAAGAQDLNLTIAQWFPWFGKLGLRGQMASEETWAAWADASARELAVAEQVKLAYYQIYFLEGAIQVSCTTRSADRALRSPMTGNAERLDVASAADRRPRGSGPTGQFISA